MFLQLLNYFTTKVHFTIFIVIMPFLLVKAQGYMPELEVNLDENNTIYLSSYNNTVFSSEANIFISKDALLYINSNNLKDDIASNPTKKTVSKNKTPKKRVAKKITLKQNNTLFTIPNSNHHFSYFGDVNHNALTISQSLYFNFKRIMFFIYSLGKISQNESHYAKLFKLNSSYYFLFFYRPPPINTQNNYPLLSISTNKTLFV